jgi:hypothetical protein
MATMPTERRAYLLAKVGKMGVMKRKIGYFPLC